MSWNYRIVTRDAGASYGIHEVYYHEDGTVRAWSEEPISPWGENPVELKCELEYMMRAFEKPFLEEISGLLVEKVLP